jgi:hypothetical protein
MKTATYLTILLAIPLVLAAQSETGKLMLRVIDDGGGSMSAAHVVIHPNDSKSQDMLLSSGSPFGEFSATLAPGVYDVFVSSRCFVPIAKQFKVVPDRQQSATVKLHMQVSQDSIAEGCPWPEDCCSQPVLVDTIPSTVPDQIPAKKQSSA